MRSFFLSNTLRIVATINILFTLTTAENVKGELNTFRTTNDSLASSPTMEHLVALWQRSSANLYDTACGTQIQEALLSLFTSQDDLQYPIPRLEGMKDLTASDGKLRILTWTHTLPDQETCYKGVVVFKSATNQLKITLLKDRLLPVGQGNIDERWFTLSTSPNEWIGAVYYAIEPFEFQGTKSYLLLGVAGHTPLCSRKVIETFYIDATDELQLGIPCLLYSKTKIFQRIFYSYSARVAMTLQFIDKGERILIDHLSPSAPQYSGIPQFYGPDASQDAFVRTESGYWRHESDILVSDPIKHSSSSKKVYQKGF
ncbi:MAG: hypothetical protein ACTTKZ_01530 [Bacteroides sp.]